jgi:hypothetical protein
VAPHCVLLRPLPADTTGAPGWAADLLVHPYVVAACARVPEFRGAMLPFAVDSIAEVYALDFGPPVDARIPYAGGSVTDPDTPLPFDASLLRADKDSAKGKQGAAASGALGALGTAASAVIASPASLLRELAASEGGGAADLRTLQTTAIAHATHSAKAKAAVSSVPGAVSGQRDTTADSAARRRGGSSTSTSSAAARPAAPALPLPAACSYDCEVRPAAPASLAAPEAGERPAASELVLRITFNPAVVLVERVALADAELDVEATEVRLRLPNSAIAPAALAAAGATRKADPGLALVLLAALPIAIDPGTARAKYSKKMATLTVTAFSLP